MSQLFDYLSDPYRGHAELNDHRKQTEKLTGVNTDPTEQLTAEEDMTCIDENSQFLCLHGDFMSSQGHGDYYGSFRNHTKAISQITHREKQQDASGHASDVPKKKPVTSAHVKHYHILVDECKKDPLTWGIGMQFYDHGLLYYCPHCPEKKDWTYPATLDLDFPDIDPGFTPGPAGRLFICSLNDDAFNADDWRDYVNAIINSGRRGNETYSEPSASVPTSNMVLTGYEEGSRKRRHDGEQQDQRKKQRFTQMAAGDADFFQEITETTPDLGADGPSQHFHPQNDTDSDVHRQLTRTTVFQKAIGSPGQNFPITYPAQPSSTHGRQPASMNATRFRQLQPRIVGHPEFLKCLRSKQIR